MIFTGKNYNFALAVVTTISTMAVSAAAKADPNPYLQADVQKAAPVSQSTVTKTPSGSKPVNSKIKKKINIIAPGGVLKDPGTGAIHVKEGPIFVKSGSPSQGGIINQQGVKSSAVDMGKEIKLNH
jgi:hypothetical protein